ncbi:MAG: hypothetical protein JXA03_08810 [Bacteroidales bacterium]|nr:hypothetical protein [Bacteroidales bacterium]
MITNDFESAELIVSTFFKISELKKTLHSENNLSVLKYLECYNDLYRIMNQAVNTENKDLLNEKLFQAIRFTNHMIEYSEKNQHGLDNVIGSRDLLMDIRQRLQLIKSTAKKKSIDF